MPGLPLVYSGDEFGAEYEPYEDPEALRWGSDPHKLRPLYRHLAELREGMPALHSGSFTELKVDSASTYAFSRETQSDGALVLLNFGGQRKTVEVILPPASAKWFASGAFVDAITGEAVKGSLGKGGRITIEIPASTPLILKRP